MNIRLNTWWWHNRMYIKFNFLTVAIFLSLSSSQSILVMAISWKKIKFSFKINLYIIQFGNSIEIMMIGYYPRGKYWCVYACVGWSSMIIKNIFLRKKIQKQRFIWIVPACDKQTRSTRRKKNIRIYDPNPE